MTDALHVAWASGPALIWHDWLQGLQYCILELLMAWVITGLHARLCASAVSRRVPHRSGSLGGLALGSLAFGGVLLVVRLPAARPQPS